MSKAKTNQIELAQNREGVAVAITISGEPDIDEEATSKDIRTAIEKLGFAVSSIDFRFK